MKKKNFSLRLEEELIARLERVAKADDRSIAKIVDFCIRGALPQIEAELDHRGGSSPFVTDNPAVSYFSSKQKKKVA
jgi:hypothetical protein